MTVCIWVSGVKIVQYQLTLLLVFVNKCSLGPCNAFECFKKKHLVMGTKNAMQRRSNAEIFVDIMIMI